MPVVLPPGPVFQIAMDPASAPGNGSLTLPLPAGDPTGWLLIAIVSDRVVGQPAAPAGWKKISSSNGMSIFTRTATLSDSGGTVTFAAWSPEVITTKTSGVVLAFSNAAAIDVVSATASTTGTSVTNPSVRTTASHTQVLYVFSPRMTTTDVLTGDAGDAGLAWYEPTDLTALRLLITADTLTTASKTKRAKGITTGPPVSWRGVTFAVRPNQPPTVPVLTSPAAGATLDAAATQRFAWTFSDPDAGDTQGAAILKIVHLSDVGFDEYYTGSNTYVDVPSSGFTAGHNYQWQVTTADQNGNYSSWSAARPFTVATRPAPPTITSPTDGSTVSGPNATVDITFPNTTRYWQLRRVADAGGIADPTDVYQDSGVQANTPSSATSAAWAFTFDHNHNPEHIQARVVGVGGLWSAWADITVNVEFFPPTATTLTVNADPATGSIDITYTGYPVHTTPRTYTDHFDVYVSTDDGATSTRVATGLTLPAPGTSHTWTYWTPASGVDYAFQVVSVAADGATAATGWIAGDSSPGDSLFGAGLYGADLFGGAA